jgi:hypothetical protein
LGGSVSRPGSRPCGRPGPFRLAPLPAALAGAAALAKTIKHDATMMAIKARMVFPPRYSTAFAIQVEPAIRVEATF